ncbi:hypothetical protein GTC6_16390 [Gordonia terrae C-6]|uniref:Uncharacterized protein n=2 Tax=Gordonia terrae TaxID=2055 RepID=R7Y7S7_9ACTN|nr:hypothetical protein GTC6_16390 [Gordonia terrae C-6]
MISGMGCAGGRSRTAMPDVSAGYDPATAHTTMPNNEDRGSLVPSTRDDDPAGGGVAEPATLDGPAGFR